MGETLQLAAAMFVIMAAMFELGRGYEIRSRRRADQRAKDAPTPPAGA